MIQLCNLGLYGYFDPCEDDVISALTENFELLDNLVQTGVINIVESLPAEPSECDSYILNTDKSYYYYKNGEWNEIEAQERFLIYNLNDSSFYYYNGSDWVLLLDAANIFFDNSGTDLVSDNVQDALVEIANEAGGGGSAGVKWAVSNAGDNPIESFYAGLNVFEFHNNSKGNQNLYAGLKVPANYQAGAQIKLAISLVPLSGTGNIRFIANSSLIEPGVGSIFTPQYIRNSVQTAFSGSTNSLSNYVLDITDASGEIDGQEVSAGDLIKINLYRDDGGDDTNNDIVNLISESNEVIYGD